MGQYWSDYQLDRITPPQVTDARGRAVVRALDNIIGDQPISTFYVRDAETCPASALPALIAEKSMEEYIDPSLPEHVQRRILKNAWILQSLKGYDSGVKMGLDLLGMTMQIEHWWQVDPKREPNTHRLIYYIGEDLFPGEPSHLNQRSTKAALRMIDATKRWSQESELFVGARLTLPANRTALQAKILSCCRTRMRVIQQIPRIRVHSTTTAIRRDIASVTRAHLTLAQNTPKIRIRHKLAAVATAMHATSRRLTLKGAT
jgi:phage tail P2-like protein